MFVDAPPAGFDTAPDPAYLQLWDEALAEHADELAAIIVEPVVQGAGGMQLPQPGLPDRRCANWPTGTRCC